MNTLRIFILSIFLLTKALPGSAIAIDANRILVLDFNNEARQVSIDSDKMNMVMQDEISRSEGYTSVRVDQIFDKWFGIKDAGADQVRDLVFGILTHGEMIMPTVYEKQKSWPVGFMIISGTERQDNNVVMHSMLINIDNGRYSMITDQVQPDESEEVMQNHMRYLLDKGYELQKIDADKEIDGLNSVVAYEFETGDGQIIEIRIKYNDIRMEPRIEDAWIVQREEESDGMKRYVLQTREKKRIELSGYYKDTKLNNVSVSVDGPVPSDSNGTREEMLSIVSRRGYVLYLTLLWKGDKLKALRIDPEVDPYGQIR